MIGDWTEIDIMIDDPLARQDVSRSRLPRFQADAEFTSAGSRSYLGQLHVARTSSLIANLTSDPA